jgi:hypothetical protein
MTDHLLTVTVPDSVPDDMPPAKICYAPVPDALTTGDMSRCDRMAGHLDMHSWEMAKALHVYDTVDGGAFLDFGGFKWVRQMPGTVDAYGVRPLPPPEAVR